MALTQEQIQQLRKKYDVGVRATAQRSPQERIAELRHNANQSVELEQHKATPEGKGFLESFAESTGLPQLLTSGIRAGQGAFGLGKAGVQRLFGDREAAAQTIRETGEKVSKPLDLGAFGEYEAADDPREVLSVGLKAGSTLGFLGAGSVAGTTGKAVATRIGAGATTGGLSAAGQAIGEEKDIGEIAKATAWGIGTGAAVSGVFEGVGAILRKMNFIKNIGKNTYNKELQPPTKDLTKNITNHWKTFGEEARNQVDDLGKPIYQGGYKTMQGQAEGVLKKAGGQLDDLARTFDDQGVNATRNEIAGDIAEEISDTFGRLKSSQLKQIEFEVRRMPNKMNVTNMIKNKRMYDNLIPDNVFLRSDEGTVAFASQVKYSLRDRLRQMIDTKTADPAIKGLNKQMSIAMDVRKLSAAQRAIRTKLKAGAAQGGRPISRLISKIWDDYIFNPAITTKASQATKRIGEKAGQTLPRRAVRAGVIQSVNSRDQK